MLESTHRFVGLLLAFAEGFGFWQRLVSTLSKILEIFCNCLAFFVFMENLGDSHIHKITKYIRGLTEKNTRLGIISSIGYFKSPIGDILSNLGVVICSLTMGYLSF